VFAAQPGKALAPKEVLFVSDIPKTRNAKVMRRIVRAAFLGDKLGDTSAWKTQRRSIKSSAHRKSEVNLNQQLGGITQPASTENRARVLSSDLRFARLDAMMPV